MTGNTFAPEAVTRAVELMRAGEPDLRSTIHREFPALTRAGVDRVLDIAQAELDRAGRDDGGSA
jgi:hypothetical protein